MATLFKLNQISAALELQDESDKNNVFLLGTGGPQAEGESATKLPTSYFKVGPKQKPVISLDATCMAHENQMNNEQIIRAFKMACLSYQPSKVNFEKVEYSRRDLIEAKQKLTNFILSKMKHLDFGNVEQDKFAEIVAQMTNTPSLSSHREEIDPKHVPLLPPTNRTYRNLAQNSFTS